MWAWRFDLCVEDAGRQLLAPTLSMGARILAFWVRCSCWNPGLDAPRPYAGAERQVRRSHAEHGSEYCPMAPTQSMGARI